MLFAPIFTKGIKAKLNELESESDIFPQNEDKVDKSELTPVVKPLTNCALVHTTIGSLAHWSIGPLAHWSTGPLIHCLNVKCQNQMSNVKCKISIRLHFCRSVSPELLR